MMIISLLGSPGRSFLRAMANSFVFSSESVGEGHPDKVADLISDSVLDACLAQDRTSRVACETMVKSNMVILAGEITTKAKLNYEAIVRAAIRDIGIMADNNDDEDSFAPIDWLADNHTEPTQQIAQKAHYALQTEGLQNALAKLDERSRRIVETRWLQDDGGLTLHELAAEYGVSAERIRQIEVKAMQKLRGFLAEEAEAI